MPGEYTAFEYEKIRDFALQENNEFDISNTEKIVILGDLLTTDILFGNLNNMVTV